MIRRMAVSLAAFTCSPELDVAGTEWQYVSVKVCQVLALILLAENENRLVYRTRASVGK